MGTMLGCDAVDAGIASIGLVDTSNLPPTDCSSREYNPEVYVTRRKWTWVKCPGGWKATPGPEVRELASIGKYPISAVLAAMRGQ